MALDLTPRDLTPAARIERAEAIVREQRDPAGEYGALGHPEFGTLPSSAVEAFYIQEIERLQRAVMGEREPAAPAKPTAEEILAAWPRYADGQTLRLHHRA